MAFPEKEEEDDDDKNTNQRKDPFNISNDEYYNPKQANDSILRTNVGGKWDRTPFHMNGVRLCSAW